jgi:hypothetical protein
MQTLYRLLRNNVQSGPFTIDELLQQQLQHADLIWVEGKSHAWSPLSDMELKPFEEAPPIVVRSQEEQPPIPMNKPLPLDLEERAEAIRKRALSYTTHHHLHRVTEEEEQVASSFTASEKIDFVDHRRERYSQAAEVFGAALVALLVIGGVAGGRYLIREKKEPVNTVTTQINAGDANAAKAAPAKSQVAAIQETPVKDTLETFKPLLVKARKRDTPTRNKTVALPLEAMGTSPKKADDVLVDQTALPASAEPPRQKEIVTVASNASAGEEKKKSLGQALKGLFKKKKKPEDSSDLKQDKDE